MFVRLLLHHLVCCLVQRTTTTTTRDNVLSELQHFTTTKCVETLEHKIKLKVGENYEEEKFLL